MVEGKGNFFAIFETIKPLCQNFSSAFSPCCCLTKIEKDSFLIILIQNSYSKDSYPNSKQGGGALPVQSSSGSETICITLALRYYPNQKSTQYKLSNKFVCLGSSHIFEQFKSYLYAQAFSKDKLPGT